MGTNGAYSRKARIRTDRLDLFFCVLSFGTLSSDALKRRVESVHPRIGQLHELVAHVGKCADVLSREAIIQMEAYRGHEVPDFPFAWVFEHIVFRRCFPRGLNIGGLPFEPIAR